MSIIYEKFKHGMRDFPFSEIDPTLRILLQKLCEAIESEISPRATMTSTNKSDLPATYREPDMVECCGKCRYYQYDADGLRRFRCSHDPLVLRVPRWSDVNEYGVCEYWERADDEAQRE